MKVAVISSPPALAPRPCSSNPSTSRRVQAVPSTTSPTFHSIAKKQTLHRRHARVAVAAFSADASDDLSVDELKAVLQDTFWGVERGLSADSDTRAEIVEIISQLEARNPTPCPNDTLEKLAGTWKLVYTSNSELVALLALGKLPLVTVGDIFQVVDGAARTVENRIQLSAPFSRTSLTATAAFEVRSPKLLQIQFTEGQVGTPELLSDFELPSSVDVLGQTVDLSMVKSALQPLDGPLRSAVSQLGGLLAGAPDLKFPISSSAPNTSWLLTTYLDDSLRISRGDGGSIFVLAKELLLLMDPVTAAAATDGGAAAAVEDAATVPPAGFFEDAPDGDFSKDDVTVTSTDNGSAQL